MRSLTFTNFHHYLTRSQALFGMGPHAALNAGLKPHMSRTGSGVFIVLSLRFLSGRRQSLDASMPRVFAILFACLFPTANRRPKRKERKIKINNTK
jgi:hypothetical protein